MGREVSVSRGSSEACDGCYGFEICVARGKSPIVDRVMSTSFLGLLQADHEAFCRHQGKPYEDPSRLQLLKALANPYFLPVVLVRLSSKMGRFGVIPSKLNYFLFGLEVARQTVIGPGLFFPHTQCTVVGAACIGRNAVIYHGVTLGASSIDFGFHSALRPTIGNDVIIGCGAAVIGSVVIGNGARVGPNVVIVNDVAVGQIVVAPEAVTLSRSNSKSSER
jgi:serine O-acetyltransferase